MPARSLSSSGPTGRSPLISCGTSPSRSPPSCCSAGRSTGSCPARRGGRASRAMRWPAAVGRFALGMFGITLLALILVQADKLILSRLLSLEAYGYYMLAATVTGMLYSLSVPVTQAIYPRMVEEVARGGG